MRRFFITVLFLMVAVMAAAFAFLNPGYVTVDYFVDSTEIPLPWMVLGVLTAGWVLGLLSLGSVLVGMLTERRRLRHAVALAEKEVDNLRNIPIRDAH